MKKGICGFVLLMAILTGFSTLAVRAQSADGKGLEWWIYQDVVIDAKEPQYEEARKEIIALLHKDRISSAEFQVMAMRSVGQACVVYAAPVNISGQGRDAANLSVDWEELFTELGPQYLNAWNRMRDATRSSAEYLIRYRPDLSYTPNNQRLRPEEQLFIRTDYYYTSPKGKRNFERVLKNLRGLHHQKALATGFRVFEIVLGPEKPGYMISAGGRSQAELEKILEADQEILGSAGETLMNRARNLSVKTERHNEQLRLDLSYFPSAQ